ncbi:hypothetical protein PROSTU_01333 [Providencia stuartii ATCC 25827]|uniref:Uncharacterized protein n=1 Tax=Providencia stuartii ATCC 25827 TaxID=471874 RepID=A0AA87CSC7_PROST|nr:hypothetical protein PROSTU_01333 [Providencia stuartii ATCC 25827]
MYNNKKNNKILFELVAIKTCQHRVEEKTAYITTKVLLSVDKFMHK